MFLFMKKKVLSVYIDESGDFGFSDRSSMLYIVSLVCFDSKNDIGKETKFLEYKLNALGHIGMVHSALLIARKNEYNKLDLKIRKDIFYTLFNYSRKIPIRIKSIVIDKRYVNTRYQLVKKIETELNYVIEDNCEYFNSFDEIVLYYDNGQDTLGSIIDNCFAVLNNITRVIDFDKEKDRLFQVVDMITMLDRLDYKIRKKIRLTLNEKNFFEFYKKILLISKDFKNKRLK